MRETVRVRMLEVAHLRVSRLNPRRDVGDVTELAASIRRVGVLAPLLVTPDGAGGYLVLAGQRRLAAARKAGLAKVPAIVRRMGEREREIAMLIENVQRVDLSPLEIATVYARLMKLHGLNQREVAEVCGMSQTHVSHHLALLNLPKALVGQVHRGEVSLAEALGIGAHRDYTAKPKQPQGRKDKCTLAAHEHCDGRRCEVRRLQRRAEVA